MKPVSWTQVALVLGTILVLTSWASVLIILDKDFTVILTLAAVIAVPVLGAFGATAIQKLDQVKEISNGNLTRIQLQLEEQSRQQQYLNEKLLSYLAQTHPGITEDHRPGEPTTDALMIPPTLLR